MTAASKGYIGRFNNPHQKHEDRYVLLRTQKVKLRYPDGEKTGFELNSNELTYTYGNAPGPPHFARLDHCEYIRDKKGRKMVFHRGGWGFSAAGAIKYGHIRVSDIKHWLNRQWWHGTEMPLSKSRELKKLKKEAHPPDATNVDKLAAIEKEISKGSIRHLENSATARKRSGSKKNGLPAKGKLILYKVQVQEIDAAWRYKVKTSSYRTYGNPATAQGTEEQQASGIRYTYLTWSWINVSGGGVARALLKDREKFWRAMDVPAIRLEPVTAKGAYVEAVYGMINTGTQKLWGWTVFRSKGANALVATRHMKRVANVKAKII